MTLSEIQDDVLGRVEEQIPPGGPVFWSLVGEVYPQMVDAMFEATLITGVVQSINNVVDIAADTTYFTLPKGAFGPLRMRSPYPIRKVSLAGLDAMVPNWQQAAPGAQIQAWFPLGVSGFGIYPTLTGDAQVVMDWIVSPVNQPRPYNGAIPLPFQAEFNDLIAMYAAAGLRSKEAGQEADEASIVFSEYLSRIKALSLWQARLDALVFTAAVGGRVEVNPRTSI